MSDSPATRILFVGDMHLGRLPSGLPGKLRAEPELGPVGAWRRVVDTALDREVHAVALAGDLVHQDNAAFGAYGPLAEGVAQLAQAGIPVCAVAGNHDAATLPRLAPGIEGLTLLGADGAWSELTLAPENRPAVRLVGWSFPREHHFQSPFQNPLPAANPAAIAFGLLHCHLGVSRSKYAPVTQDELRGAGFDGWFLGHEHIPGDPGGGEPFYLGSLTPLDSSETGIHGPVLVHVRSDGQPFDAERLPLAPVRWEQLDLPCPETVDPEAELSHLILDRAITRHGEIEVDQQDLRALGLSIRLTGTVADPDAWSRAIRALDLSDLKVEQGRALVFIRKVESDLRIRRDLRELAAGNDPAGLLARRILVLENGAEPVPGVPDSGAEAVRLVTAARARLEEVNLRTHFDRFTREEASPTEEEALRAVQADLARIARRTLDRLLVQKGGAGATD